MIWIIVWILFKSWTQDWKLRRLSLLLKESEKELTTIKQKHQKTKLSLDKYRKSYDELLAEYAKMYKQLTDISKKDNPRITTMMLKQQILDLHEQWLNCKQIWVTLGFDKSSIAKALKRWWVTRS